MKVLITGICGFVGSSVANLLHERFENIEVAGIDNLSRPGSEANRLELASKSVAVFHGDQRMQSDVAGLPNCEWVIDAAANPSVLAGIDGRSSARQVAEHNLSGTLNILEYCRERKAGLILLSTSRVYSIRNLAALPMAVNNEAFALDVSKALPNGVDANGLKETFATMPPISLYGATKLASEVMASEYAFAFGFPLWINRCGVLAGAGQFGTAEQGIFSYWLHAHASRRALRYIGFGGLGRQVRDAFHPDDLADLIASQIRHSGSADPVYNVGGGKENAMSLAQLTRWCDERFGQHAAIPDDRPRPFDIPWVVMDYARATRDFGWSPKRTLASILDEIAQHAVDHPDWLARCAAV